MKSVSRGLRLSALALALPCTALAQPAPADARSEAVQLLEQAKQLEAAGSGTEACHKYGESYSLNAELDALLPWASCLEQSGKLASAYAAFLDAVAVAERISDSRAATANERANQLRPRLSYLTIEVADAQRLPALSVERDGFRVGSSGWGVPFAVDPGTHVIVVKAYGYRDWQTTVEIDGDAAAPYVEVPPLEKLDESASSEPVPSAPAPAAIVAAPPLPTPSPDRISVAPLAPAVPDRDRARLPPMRIAALIAGGVGVVSGGLGLYFWGKTRDTLDQRDGICPTSKNCEPGTNARLADLTSHAISSQHAEIAAFAVAGVAVAIAGTLWIVGGHEHGGAPSAFVVPSLSPTSAGFTLGGTL